ncbi:MAG: L-threonylcarbamoyladenylate synthase [Casimicrobiaceae bacterium]
MRLVAADDAGIARAVEVLSDGGLVAFPTETVYGLGADARNADAVRRLFAAKGRPADHPVIVHLATAAAAMTWARLPPVAAHHLAAAFWPGPLTLIVPRAAGVDDVVTGGQDTVGLRVPSHPVAQRLLATFGGGIAAPSANRFGRISPTTAEHVADDLGDRVDLILDGGACSVGIESTIVACIDDRPMLLRPGGIGAAALEAVLVQSGGAPLAMRRDDAPRASGTLASHYAPRTPARLVDAADLAACIARASGTIAVLARSMPAPAAFRGAWIAAPRDAESYTRELYANLRRLDREGAEVILVEMPPDEAAWHAVHDRLARAAHPAEPDAMDDID